MTLSQPLYSTCYYKTPGLFELIWLPGTRELTDQDFRGALSVFAAGALEHHTPNLIVDMRQFMSRPSAQVLAWRDEVIVPKYTQAGVKKIAWIWPGMKSEMGSGATAKERYFESRDEAVGWILATG